MGVLVKRDTASIHTKNIPNGCIVNIFFLFLYAACLQQKFIYSSYCEFIFAIQNFFITLVTLKRNIRNARMKGGKEVIRYL